MSQSSRGMLKLSQNVSEKQIEGLLQGLSYYSSIKIVGNESGILGKIGQYLQILIQTQDISFIVGQNALEQTDSYFEFTNGIRKLSNLNSFSLDLMGQSRKFQFELFAGQLGECLSFLQKLENMNLIFKQASYLQVNGIKQILSGMRLLNKLKQLSISLIFVDNIDFYHIIQEAFYNLNELMQLQTLEIQIVENFYYCQEELISLNLGNLINLTTFKFTYKKISYLNNFNLDDLSKSLSKFHNLTILSVFLNDLHFSSQQLEIFFNTILGLKMLEEAKIKFLEITPQSQLNQITNHQKQPSNLKKLNFDFVNIYKENSKEINYLQFDTSLFLINNLKKLKLKIVEFVIDQSQVKNLFKWLQECKSLEILYLILQYDQPKIVVLEEIGQGLLYLGQLKKLELKLFDNETFQEYQFPVIKAISQMKNLECLYLQKCLKTLGVYQGDFNFEILKNLTSLTTLELVNINQFIDEKCFEWIGNSLMHFPSLNYLQVQIQNFKNLRGLDQIANGLKQLCNLRQLIFAFPYFNNSVIDDNDINGLISFIKSLRYLVNLNQIFLYFFYLENVISQIHQEIINSFKLMQNLRLIYLRDFKNEHGKNRPSIFQKVAKDNIRLVNILK